MKKYLVFLFPLIFYSCQTKTIEKSGGLLIDVAITDVNPSDNNIKSAIGILQTRINSYSRNNPSVALNDDKKGIQIKLPLVEDSTLFKNLIQTKGNLEILETYDNRTIYKCLFVVNNKLIKNHNYSFHVPTNPLASKLKTVDSPLFGILKPSIANDSILLVGPVIGYSKSDDTALVYSIIHFKEFAELFPPAFDCKWQREPKNNMYSLIAIK